MSRKYADVYSHLRRRDLRNRQESGHAKRLVGVARDVTEQKTLQKKLQEQRDETENIFKSYNNM